MTLQFPLSLAHFYDLLGVRESVFHLPSSLEMDRTGGGEVIFADHGTRLWEGSVTLVDGYASGQGGIEAKLALLQRGGASFFVYPRAYAYPAADPLGAVLGASAVTISAVAVDNRSLSLQGLPAGYKLTAGDFLAFSYGSNPVRYALHRVVSDATAGGAGQMASVEVMPNIRPGVALATAVTLKKPSLKAVLMPASVAVGKQGLGQIVSGASFQFVQTLR